MVELGRKQELLGRAMQFPINAFHQDSPPCFETWSCLVVYYGLELTLQLGVTWNWQFSCLFIQSTGITGIYQQAWHQCLPLGSELSDPASVGYLECTH